MGSATLSDVFRNSACTAEHRLISCIDTQHAVRHARTSPAIRSFEPVRRPLHSRVPQAAVMQCSAEARKSWLQCTASA